MESRVHSEWLRSGHCKSEFCETPLLPKFLLILPGFR